MQRIKPSVATLAQQAGRRVLDLFYLGGRVLTEREYAPYRRAIEGSMKQLHRQATLLHRATRRTPSPVRGESR